MTPNRMPKYLLNSSEKVRKMDSGIGTHIHTLTIYSLDVNKHVSFKDPAKRSEM